MASVSDDNTVDPSAAIEGTGTTSGGWVGPAVSAMIVLAGLVITAIYRQDILDFGTALLLTYGQQRVDLVLLVVSMISSTPLALPIWTYILVGVALGVDVLRMSIVMALGSATGSVVTYLLGRYYGNSAWVQRRFPSIHKHPWTEGRSKRWVTLLLYLTTSAPLPCELFYAACGAKRYPVLLFWVIMVAARFTRYVVMGYTFMYFSDILEKVL